MFVCLFVWCGSLVRAILDMQNVKTTMGMLGVGTVQFQVGVISLIVTGFHISVVLFVLQLFYSLFC